jgi:hypothetical protein
MITVSAPLFGQQKIKPIQQVKMGSTQATQQTPPVQTAPAAPLTGTPKAHEGKRLNLLG